MPASASEPKDIGSLMWELGIPLALQLVLNTVLVGRCHAFDYAIQMFWIIPAMLCFIAELVMYLSLVSPAPWCSNPFGYVASISAFAGDIERQGQIFLLLLLISMLMASTVNVGRRQAARHAITGEPSFFQACISFTMHCDWSGLGAYLRSTAWREPVASLGETMILLGALCAVVTGVLPFTHGHEACSLCLRSMLNDWHNGCIKSGVALALVGVLCIFLEKVCELGRGNDRVSIFCLCMLLALVIASIVLWDLPQLLPPYAGVGPGVEGDWLCLNIWTQEECEPPRYAPNQRCVWNASAVLPLHRCVGQMPTSESDPTPFCQFHGLANNRAMLWEIHLVNFCVSFANGALAYVAHFHKSAHSKSNDAILRMSLVEHGLYTSRSTSSSSIASST